ncbi:hypothetical protein F4553_003711 [Allocatelliglobosispora scoriae]|uniref:Uncharacterized protein n=1 Tax=Allocatelliglobosispora scoriae TaxID=643052 RepID=A0A841BUB0_9ACTN|nr:hypothetical protein [Allocatelliglobosispora scoriae]MBB5870332.1 hypothetical protein [Allocatelliglobosispora scoriae]
MGAPRRTPGSKTIRLIAIAVAGVLTAVMTATPVRADPPQCPPLAQRNPPPPPQLCIQPWVWPDDDRPAP